jgi:Family of unknown function (DUF6491)
MCAVRSSRFGADAESVRRAAHDRRVRIAALPFTASLRAAVLLALLSARAGAEAPPQPEDPVLVPDTAVAVDHARIYGSQSWTPLNTRMLLVRVGTRRYLFVFDTPCVHLTQRNAVISTSTDSTSLLAGSDFIYVATGPRGSAADAVREARLGFGTPCRIDHIYSILKEDAQALREQFAR